MAVLSGNRSFETALGTMEKSKAIRGGMNMYDVITEAWNEGLQLP